MSAVKVRVPAKINLQLSVGPLLQDGFHELATVFSAVSLFDTVTVRRAEALSLSCAGPYSAVVPTDQRNLAWQAATLLAQQLGRQPEVSIHIDKHIPVAGGMAGGSADAAATLLALGQLWGVDSTAQALQPLAAQLGSDVAFPLWAGVAVGTGRGETIQPVLCSASMWWVVVTSAHTLATPKVFAQLDRIRRANPAAHPLVGKVVVVKSPKSRPQPSPQAGERGAPAVNPALLAALEAGDIEAIAGNLSNDLQPAAVALRPELADTLDTGRQAGALACLVSGSGPTCLFLARDQAHAHRLAAQLGPLALVACSPAHTESEHL